MSSIIPPLSPQGSPSPGRSLSAKMTAELAATAMLTAACWPPTSTSTSPPTPGLPPTSHHSATIGFSETELTTLPKVSSP